MKRDYYVSKKIISKLRVHTYIYMCICVRVETKITVRRRYEMMQRHANLFVTLLSKGERATSRGRLEPSLRVAGFSLAPLIEEPM